MQTYVGDEWSVDGVTATVAGIDSAGGVHLSCRERVVGWDPERGAFYFDATGKPVPMTLTWTQPRVGDEWLSPVGERYVVAEMQRTVGGGAPGVRTVCKLVPVNDRHHDRVKRDADEMRAQGWRPAPRSPRPAAAPPASTSNPEPKVGDVWQYGQHAANWVVTEIDGSYVKLTWDDFDPIREPLSAMRTDKCWRRISEAPKDADAPESTPASCSDAAIMACKKADVHFAGFESSGATFDLRFAERNSTLVRQVRCVRDVAPIHNYRTALTAIRAEQERQAAEKPRRLGRVTDHTTAIPAECIENGHVVKKRLVRWFAREEYGVELNDTRTKKAAAMIGDCDVLCVATLVRVVEPHIVGLREESARSLAQNPPQFVVQERPKPTPTWRELFHDVAANPPRYGRETWGKRAVKALWVRAAANCLEATEMAPDKRPVLGSRTWDDVRQACADDVDSEYRRLGGEVW